MSLEPHIGPSAKISNMRRNGNISVFDEKLASQIFYFSCLALFSLSYVFNVFSIVSPPLHVPLDRYSLSEFILPTIADRVHGFPSPMVSSSGVLYLSQVGLHGRIYQLIQSELHLRESDLIFYLQVVLGVTFSGTLAALFYALRPFFGWAPTISSAIAIAFAPRLAQYANDLYWVATLALLPMVIVALCYQRVRSDGRHRWFLFLLFLSSYAKFLCGYEFVTTIILAPLFLILLQEPLSEWTSRSVIWRLFLTGLALVAGFALALVTQAVQIHFVAQVDSLSVLLDRMNARSFGDEYKTYFLTEVVPHQIDIFKQVLKERFSLDDSQVSFVVNHAFSGYLVSGITIILSYFAMTMIGTQGSGSIYYFVIPFGGGIPFIYAFLSSLIALPLAYSLSKRNPSLEWLPRSGIVSLLSLLAPVSWFALAFNHSIIHSFVVVDLLFLPWGILCILFVAATVWECLKLLVGGWGVTPTGGNNFLSPAT